MWLALAIVSAISVSAFAQAADASTPSRSPLGGLGTVVIWLICANRKKKEIGGWLLLFYIQMYGGALMTLIFTPVSISNYNPASWVETPALYPLFLISTLPGIVLRFVELFVAERARRGRSWTLIRTLRMLLWIDIGAAIVGALIDGAYFEDSLPLSVLALAWPSIWLPYFYFSKRVRRVFDIKDWPAEPGRTQLTPATPTSPEAHIASAQVGQGGSIACMACGAAIPPMVRFCSSCGQQVAQPPDAKSSTP
jgi:hypothetical protein